MTRNNKSMWRWSRSCFHMSMWWMTRAGPLLLRVGCLIAVLSVLMDGPNLWCLHLRLFLSVSCHPVRVTCSWALEARRDIWSCMCSEPAGEGPSSIKSCPYLPSLLVHGCLSLQVPSVPLGECASILYSGLFCNSTVLSSYPARP